MSKAENTPAIVIEDFVPPRKANPYDGHIAALIEAGEGKAVTISTEQKLTRDGKPDEGRPARTQFQAAARDAGYSARVRQTNIAGDDVFFTFTISKLKPATDSPAVADDDTVDDVEATV